MQTEQLLCWSGIIKHLAQMKKKSYAFSLTYDLITFYFEIVAKLKGGIPPNSNTNLTLNSQTDSLLIGTCPSPTPTRKTKNHF